MTRFNSDHTDRPAAMMDLLDHHTVQPVTRLPNRRALAVLDQMFGYYDPIERTESVDLSYDHVAA